MLKILKNEANLTINATAFFIVALFLVGNSFLFTRNIIDVIYFVVLIGYFWKFLVIRNK